MADKSLEVPPVPWEYISQLRRPATLRYRELVAQLLRANQASESGEDDLSVISRCLVGAMHFIDDDPVVAASGLTRPLGTLAASLRDLTQGSRPPLFFNQPKHGPGRPKDISFDAVRGTAAAAVTALIDWGEARGSSAKIVVDALQRARIKAPGGNSVTSVQALRWRDEMGSRASALAESTYRDVCAKFVRVPPAVAENPHARRKFIGGMIAGIRSMGF